MRSRQKGSGFVSRRVVRGIGVKPLWARKPQSYPTPQDAPAPDAYDVVAVAPALQVDRPHQINLVEVVGGAGLRTGVVLAWQQRGQPDARRGQAVALQDALDGTLAGQRANAQGLQLGQDRHGSGQAVAGGRRGMGLEPAADGEDGPLQFGRDVLSDVMAGPRQVVEALGSGLQVAAPPLVEPGLAAAQRRADVLGGPTGEAQTDGALTRREFVVHGVLRGAAAGGCPRGTF